MARNPLLQEQSALAFSHMGFYVTDLARMTHFYTEVMGFTQTDQGHLGAVQLVFLSRDPSEHHQVVLATGRPEGLSFNLINQLSKINQYHVKMLAYFVAVQKGADVDQPRNLAKSVTVE